MRGDQVNGGPRCFPLRERLLRQHVPFDDNWVWNLNLCDEILRGLVLILENAVETGHKRLPELGDILVDLVEIVRVFARLLVHKIVDADDVVAIGLLAELATKRLNFVGQFQNLGAQILEQLPHLRCVQHHVYGRLEAGAALFQDRPDLWNHVRHSLFL